MSLFLLDLGDAESGAKNRADHLVVEHDRRKQSTKFQHIIKMIRLQLDLFCLVLGRKQTIRSLLVSF